MYEQQNNRDRDQKMMFSMQGVPQIKLICINYLNGLEFWLLCVWLDDSI